MIIQSMTGTMPGSQYENTIGRQMGQDAFLKLLITQLRNQDPLSPMEDREFIAQLAQFSSLEQMQTMNQTMQAFAHSQTAFQSASLIGRTVTAVDPADGEQFTGIVESVLFDSGMSFLRVDGKDVPLGLIVSVS